jgi:putative membrane protein
MDIKRTRSFWAVMYWTRWDIFLLIILATIPTTLYQLLDWKWLALPWLPIAMIGTAVSFIIGFKNNASYDRAWEARQIWGSIVNASRSLVSTMIGYLDALSMPADERQHIYIRVVNRHLAWLTALRFQLREHRQWEAANHWYNDEFRKKSYTIEEHEKELPVELKKYLSAEEYDYIIRQTNKPAQVLAYQSREFGKLHADGIIDKLQLIDLQNGIKEIFNQQGGSERIKNFPYPRQYATLNLFFIRIFTFLLPFGMLQEFERLLGPDYVWLTIPFSTLVGWIFNTMEKIGEASENPFEGGTNDIPITQLSRSIEIDLLEMIQVPHQLKPKLPQSDVLT